MCFLFFFNKSCLKPRHYLIFINQLLSIAYKILEKVVLTKDSKETPL